MTPVAREQIRALLQIDDLDPAGTRLEGFVLEPRDVPGEYRVPGEGR